MNKEKLGDNNLEILMDMLKCSSADCAGDFKLKKFWNEEDLIEYLVQKLPTLPYVTNQIMKFIFSDGLTTGIEEKDEALNKWLYSTNILGQTNYSVLQEGVIQAEVFGKNGIRWLSKEDGVINVHSRSFACLVEENEEYFGFNDILGYLITADDRKIWETDATDIEFDRDVFDHTGRLVDKERKMMLLSGDEFLNLRNNTTKNDGDSPLKYDQERVELLLTVYKRLNHDVKYDGPGRIVLWYDNNVIKGDENALSTESILNTTTIAKKDRDLELKREIAGLAGQIKEAGSDQVIAISNHFKDKIQHLPRTTKATEFFDWIGDESVVLCQLFSVSPILLNLGDIAGNVSMEAILDNAMLNDIIPKREVYATQISAFLADKLGLPKIYFNKYNMKQAKDEVSRVKTFVEAMRFAELAKSEKVKEVLEKIFIDDFSSAGKIKSLTVENKNDNLLKKVNNLFKGGKRNGNNGNDRGN